MVTHMNKRQREFWLRKKTIGKYLFCKGCCINLNWYKDPQALVDHKDNIPTNNTDENIQILCRSCNHNKNSRGKAKSKKQKPKPNNPLQQLTRSEATNLRAEPQFREWVVNSVKSCGLDGFEIEDAINSGAEMFSVSIATTPKWLAKMTSPAGKLRVIGACLFTKHDVDRNFDEDGNVKNNF